MLYSIGEFARLTNLSVHTLRYYEQEGLLCPERNAANRRCYSESDLAWVDFIKRLKATGMPIKEIKRYAELRELGESSLRERMEMLLEHRELLKKQIEHLQAHLAKLDEKISIYRNKTIDAVFDENSGALLLR